MSSESELMIGMVAWGSGDLVWSRTTPVMLPEPTCPRRASGRQSMAASIFVTLAVNFWLGLLVLDIMFAPISRDSACCMAQQWQRRRGPYYTTLVENRGIATKALALHLQFQPSPRSHYLSASISKSWFNWQKTGQQPQRVRGIGIFPIFILMSIEITMIWSGMQEFFEESRGFSHGITCRCASLPGRLRGPGRWD